VAGLDLYSLPAVDSRRVLISRFAKSINLRLERIRCSLPVQKKEKGGQNIMTGEDSPQRDNANGHQLLAENACSESTEASIPQLRAWRSWRIPLVMARRLGGKVLKVD